MSTPFLQEVQFALITGVAVGSGWQAKVAYINLGCYYIIGVPLGVVMGWLFNLGVTVCCVWKITMYIIAPTS